MLQVIIYIFGIIGGFAAVYQIIRWLREWREQRIDTFASIERNALKLLEEINASGFRPTVVIGIGRSGAFLGGWLAGNLGSLPIRVFEREFQDDNTRPVFFTDFKHGAKVMNETFPKDRRALIVEGASTSGSTLRGFERLRSELMSDWECKYCVLYNLDTASFKVDYVAKTLTKAPNRYPWHKTSVYKDFLRISKNLTIL